MRDVLPTKAHRIRAGLAVLSAASAAAGVVALAGPVSAHTQAAAPAGHRLVVAQGNGSTVSLSGHRVTQGEKIMVSGTPSGATVTYFLDSRVPVAHASSAPYAWTVNAASGSHSLTARVQVASTTTVVQAAFTVAPATAVKATAATPSHAASSFTRTGARSRPVTTPSPTAKPTPTPSKSTPKPSASTTTAAPTPKPSASTTTAAPTPKPSASTTTAAPVSTGARLFGASSLWNKPKTGLTFASAATKVLSGLTYGVNNGSYDHPMYFAASSDPTTTFKLGAGWGFPATTITTPAPAGMHPASGGDAVMDVLLTDGRLLDMYGVKGSGTSWTATYYGVSDGVNGTGFGAQPYTAIGTTAIGSPQAGGTILARDVAAGAIPHALCMAFDYTDLGGVGTSGTPAVAPAVNNDAGGGPGPLPEGGLLVIPAGTAMPSGLSAMGQALWTAAQTYGVYITDQLGGQPMFFGDGSSTVDNAFKSSDFTAVGRALRLADTW